ncbi:hypothetical protein L6164_031134 [Bauhinia variegata]|uniref:Uncharacterized protein n=1 Tax=Bauhinia variegata TaxID=167791 RepID=A0ACB9LEI3_BAUVA|nr:hypothetical protein L6164_031134 [Bauhinia variegata]
MEQMGFLIPLEQCSPVCCISYGHVWIWHRIILVDSSYPWIHWHDSGLSCNCSGPGWQPNNKSSCRIFCTKGKQSHIGWRL